MLTFESLLCSTSPHSLPLTLTPSHSHSPPHTLSSPSHSHSPFTASSLTTTIHTLTPPHPHTLTHLQCFTSIVGPNGSGKSNVIDAMLFVFGYRARKIRSKKISVLIHNSDEHRDLQSCTVAVHFQRIVDLVRTCVVCVAVSCCFFLFICTQTAKLGIGVPFRKHKHARMYANYS